MTGRLSVFGIEGIGEVTSGADLAGLIIDATEEMGSPLCDRDVVVVTQKIVSKAEGRWCRWTLMTP
ncbi:MAG: coenzyme F420-0:L-glutamate ligase [Microthrixaceae bacterium]|nr:coenzyme F420-0:L-glutamate ligase [Microthrixaceae bacterium]